MLTTPIYLFSPQYFPVTEAGTFIEEFQELAG